MKCVLASIPLAGALLGALLCGCSSDSGSGEGSGDAILSEGHGEHDREAGEHGVEGRGEHDREAGEHGLEGREGEESGEELALDAVYDKVRNGARLILAYDARSNTFKGTVENTISRSLRSVRVEVHLSNGVELGPTKPVDLAPGAKRDIQLAASDSSFKGWTAHPEVGRGEHDSSEGRGEHDRDGG